MRKIHYHQPGTSFHQQAAQHIWHFLQEGELSAKNGLQSHQNALIVVPTAAQIAALRTAIAQQSSIQKGNYARFMPRIVTLDHWLDDLVPDPKMPVKRSHIARLLSIQQILKKQDWLRKALGVNSDGALWGLAQSVLAVCDELALEWLVPATPATTNQNIEQQEALFEQALSKAYNKLCQRVLGEESTLILTLWRHLTSLQDPLPIRWRQLQALAKNTHHSVIWCAPTLPNAMEKGFLQALDKNTSVLEIYYAWQLGETGSLQQTQAEQGLASILKAWPECADDPSRLISQSTLPSALQTLTLIPATRFEDEANLAAQALIAAFSNGARKTALIAQDRIVARRVRALLARAEIPVRDETGWQLSTTRAAASIMAWFDLIKSGMQQGPDANSLLDFLKNPFVLANLAQLNIFTSRLEALIRLDGGRSDWKYLRALAHQISMDLQNVYEQENKQVNPLELIYEQAVLWNISSASLSQWEKLFSNTLNALGLQTALNQDPAGKQLLEVIAQLTQSVSAESEELGSIKLNAQEWRALVMLSIESAVFKEPMPSSELSVTILPLNGARMRSFDYVVMVGGDDQQLPSPSQDTLFFSNQLRKELNLPDQDLRYKQQARDVAELLLNNLQVLVTWQSRGASGENQRISPWFERLQNAQTWNVKVDAASLTVLKTQKQLGDKPAPIIGDLLPMKLSASAYNVLRRCPYQFFSNRVLGLQALNEIDEPLEKSDVGRWLHQILFDFHATVPSNADTTAQLSLLTEISNTVFQAAISVDGHALGYWVRWQALLPSYIAWQQSIREQGWQWQAGEVAVEQVLPLQNGMTLQLHGRLDRIDTNSANSTSRMVRDYKTQTIKKLTDKSNAIEEDCQLPFYALLDPNLTHGCWVALDGDKVGEVGLPDKFNLHDLANQLSQQIQQDYQAMINGKGLAAIGDEAACRYCEARGICRKTYWPDVSENNMTGEGHV